MGDDNRPIAANRFNHPYLSLRVELEVSGRPLCLRPEPDILMQGRVAMMLTIVLILIAQPEEKMTDYLLDFSDRPIRGRIS